MAAPLFGGFAATGAIARTATSIRNGATSPLAGITHAATLVAVLLFLAPLASSIPLAALAAILFVVAWNMSEVKHFTHILRRAPVADRAILVITFLLTVFADLVVAVNVGVTLAVLQFMRRMAESVETQPVESASLTAELAEFGLSELPSGVVVYEIAGPMFFGAVEKFERALLETHTLPRSLVLRLDRVPFMDITGIQTLEEVIHELRRKNVNVILCEANVRVHVKLDAAGVMSMLGETGYQSTLHDALIRAGVGSAQSAHDRALDDVAQAIEKRRDYLHGGSDDTKRT
jgi:SulP family sulfate permease